MEGLFGGLGGGFDMDAILRMLNPVGAANAAPALGPNGAPAAFPTEQDLLNSAPAALPVAGFPPEPVGSPSVPRSVTAQPIAPTVASAPPAPAVETDVGAALAAPPVAAPQSLEARAPLPGAEGPVAPSPEDAMASAGARRPSLAEALKRVQAPRAPELQKISSPNAPRPTGTIKSGELMALLTALNAGGAGKPPRLGGYRWPDVQVVPSRVKKSRMRKDRSGTF